MAVFRFLKYIFVIMPLAVFGQATTVYNDGVSLYVAAGTSVYLDGMSFTNQTNGADGNITNDGNIYVEGNWTNNATAGNMFATAAGLVEFNSSTAGQIIGGTRTSNFYDLTFNNSFAAGPQFTLGIDISAANTLTMSNQTPGWKINLAGYTLTLGTAAGAPGTLVHGGTNNDGWMYGGSFKRWFSTSTIADGDVAGRFPLGSAIHYRPFYVYFPTTGPSAGGSVTILHTNATTVSNVSFADGAFTVKRRHNANFNVITDDGLTVASGNTMTRLEGTGYGQIGNVNDLRMTRVADVLGVAGTNGGNASNPVVRRTFNVPVSGLTNQTYYLSSIDETSSPLPVELLSFEAKLNAQKKVDLEWVTSTEINNDYFTVERTKDGINFEQVAIVNGAGNSSSPKNYSAIDEHPLAGISYYRLKQTDFDGKYTYSQLRPIELLDDNGFLFSVYPNPSRSGDLNLLFISNVEGMQVPVTVFDANGKMIHSELINGGSSKEITKHLLFDRVLADGIYLIKAEYKGAVYIQRVVIY